MDLADRLACARGDRPAELLLRGGRVVNVASREIVPEDVAIAGGTIVGLGPGYEAEEVRDLDGAYVAPAFIEGHLHVESSLLTPRRLAPLLAARGTGTVVCDPHEIANVCGLDGVRWVLEAAKGLPLNLLVMLSSCVPASHLGTAGATLDAGDLEPLRDEAGVLGLAEVMSFPLVVDGEGGVLDKLERFAGRPIDGHAPGLSGRGLNAYAAAGPRSDHECTTADEAREKLRRGMRVMIREGSTAKNLDSLIGVVQPGNARRFMLVTDDRHVGDVLALGHLDHQLRLAVGAGVDPVDAVGMVTLNVAEHFRLHDRGVVAPGMRADVVVLDDLIEFEALLTLHGGVVVAEGAGDVREVAAGPPPPDSAVRVTLGVEDLAVPVQGPRMRVIGAMEGQIVTRALEMEPTVRDGMAVADSRRDLAKIAVFERHGAGGGSAVGFVHGLGLRRGAMASTVAHDCHNLVVAGCEDAEMVRAARAVADAGGGIAVAGGGGEVEVLALPVGGLMSEAPAEEVAAAHAALATAVRERLGSPVGDPMMLLSFLALEVIPELKLSDCGLVDVGRFELVDLFLS